MTNARGQGFGIYQVLLCMFIHLHRRSREDGIKQTTFESENTEVQDGNRIKRVLRPCSV